VGALVIISMLVIIASGNFVFTVSIGIICLCSLVEMYRTIDVFKKDCVLSNIGIIYALCIVLSCVIGVYKNILTFEYFSKIFMIATVLYMITVGICKVLRFDETDYSLLASQFFTTIYISLMYMHLVLIRQLECGNILSLMTILIAWLTDTFAYFSGRFLGKHKLIEKVSAKKTIEGAIGGTVLCVIIMVILSNICAYFNYKVNYINIAVLSLFGAIVSQFGDLVASCIKRQYNKKDYGNILLGHGGFMDRFDSVLLVSPVVYYICLVLSVITK
jgi:phosphatidate cytidylyltransferase